MAVMTGFREELQRQILGVTSHVVVQSFSGKMNGSETVLQHTNKVENVAAAAPYIVKQVMLTYRGNVAGVVMRGVDPVLEKGVSNLAENLVKGDLQSLAGFGVILGKSLARKLGVGIDDRVTVIAPVGNVTIAGTVPRMKRFRVKGIFDAGMYEYDNTLAYIHINDAQIFFRMGDAVTGIEIKTIDPELAFKVRKTLEKDLKFSYWVQDWMQMNSNFFRALQMEKATMFIILLLVVVVAAFNIVSSLIMVVMEKGRDIAILKTMGATSGGIMKIFLINGMVIGLVGTLAGLSLGLALAMNLETVLAFIESVFGIHILSGEVYYIDHLPSVIVPGDVLAVVIISLLITMASALYPAWRAGKVDPVESLRYE